MGSINSPISPDAEHVDLVVIGGEYIEDDENGCF